MHEGLVRIDGERMQKVGEALCGLSRLHERDPEVVSAAVESGSIAVARDR